MLNRSIYFIYFVLGIVLVNSASAELTGHWNLDEGSGDVAFDISGNGYDGNINGAPNWVPGVGGSALEFDGYDDYVGTGQSLLDNMSEFTLALWVAAGNSGDSRIGLVGQNNLIEMGFMNGNVELWTPVTETTNTPWTFDDFTWHHITIVGHATSTNIYLDGELSATGRGAAYYGTSTFPVNIGGGGVWDGNGNWFSGWIDDVRIYNHALSEIEIHAAMNGAGRKWPFALNPAPEDGSIHADTWANLVWTSGSFAASHDVFFSDNFDEVSAGAEGAFQGNQTLAYFTVGFSGVPYPDGLVPGTTYYWRIDEVNDTEPNSPWKGPVWSFSIPPLIAYNPDPADGAESVDTDVTLSWSEGLGSLIHSIYFGDNFDEVDKAAGNPHKTLTTYTPGPLQMAKTYYWRVDEHTGGRNSKTLKGDIWSFTTQGAVNSPSPANGAVDTNQTAILSWSPGIFGTSYDIYFGTNKEAVRNADTSSPEYKGSGNLGSESYDPGKLEWNTTYYWRVDDTDNTNPDSPWKGPVWSFTTANFLIVDDFESYDDLYPDHNRIFRVWIDGLDNDPSINGSIVGYDKPPFAEQTIVHSGNQSMPLFYDNAVGISEATKALTYPRDWTENGVETLVIWYLGDAENAAEPIYVALNDSAVVINDNPNAARVDEWTEWNIDLQKFVDQGIDLADINSITLGLGDRSNPVAGGSGKMYFDDIRLYQSRSAP